MSADKQELWEAVVERAQAIINELLARKSTREALVEISGSETVAEFLADVEDGDYSDALEKAALAKAEKDLHGVTNVV
jgi:hypothetical protein